MTLVFSDREYRMAHGKAPAGRGWWWFTFCNGDRVYEYSVSGTLTQAKKACAKYAEQSLPGYIGTISVTIGS